MIKATQKQLYDNIVNAFVCGSVTQLNTAFKQATHAQIASLGKSQKWEQTVRKNSAQLTPYKAYLFANTIFKIFGANDLFDVFLEHCPPVRTYLEGIKPGHKPSVVAAVNQWVCASAINDTKTFGFLNSHLDKDVARMHSDGFLNENDIWWPSIQPNVMQSIAQLQPTFVEEFQNAVIEILTTTAQLLTTLHPIIPTPTSAQKKCLENAVHAAMSGQRPYLYVLMGDHLQEILFGSTEDDNMAQKIALSFVQAEMYICLIALQTWNEHHPLTDIKFGKVNEVLLALDDDQRQKISTYSDIHASDLLNKCQAVYIQQQLGNILPKTAIRKI